MKTIKKRQLEEWRAGEVSGGAAGSVEGSVVSGHDDVLLRAKLDHAHDHGFGSILWQ